MNRSVIDAVRGVLVIALLLVLRVSDAQAQAAPSPSLPDAAHPAGPPAPGSDWAGVYVGAHAGASTSGSAWTATQPNAPAVGGSVTDFRPYDVFDGSGSQFGGFAVGYNHRAASHVMIGLEGDLSFAAEPVVGAVPYADTAELFGTARARIGYVPHRRLYYATGGLAWTRNRVSFTDSSAGSVDGTAPAAFTSRVGWTIGGGIEAPVATGWTARAEYLYSHFGVASVALPPAAQIASDFSMHEVRIGVNYQLANGHPATGGPSDAAPRIIVPLETGQWAVHGQTTYVSQYAPPFRAPYSGPNSLASNIGRETWDATLYVGRRLWNGAEVWINPEIDQGFGLSNTLGVAGFTSGEAYKVGFTHPYLRVPRAFVRQTVDLGGGTEAIESDLNQFAGAHAANRIVVTLGKLSVSDLFDTITYAHDPRNDFMNWSLVDAGTWDYAADAWGFTYGAAIEWYQGQWTARAGVFDLSVVPNSVELDHHFDQLQVVYELEHRHEVRGRSGKLAVVGFVSHGRMGRLDDAITVAQQTGGIADTANVRRNATRPGVNLNIEQQIASDVGVFARLGWANGDFETFEFTDIDHTASAGMSVAGARWGRAHDTFGIATVVNGISNARIAYLNAGGLGVLIGDGQLPHPGLEEILETYYRLPLRSWQLTADYQLVVHPAYNRDRGPVSVVSARVRKQF
jgi:high affinity Mn2+ porin